MTHQLQLGVYIIRIGMGFMLFLHGLHKLIGGDEELTGLGNEFSELITMDLPAYPIGLMAAATQLVCGLVIAAGYNVFWASLAGLSTMLVATVVLLSKGEPFSHFSHPIEFSIALIALAIMHKKSPN